MSHATDLFEVGREEKPDVIMKDNWHKNRYTLQRVILLILLTVLLHRCTDDKGTPTQNGALSLFSKIPASQSGVNFINSLQHDVSTTSNLLDFDYFYNGAGVGVGDFNNDGLPDIFFCGNQVDNRLFLNRGDLRFEDITAHARINENKNWSNGVALADVNQDGWLDIYISQGGPGATETRGNLLYINQGDLSFEEMGAVYGLNDYGISTQSAFFDFDKDGDLDCFVMNESLLYGYDPVRFQQIDSENSAEIRASYSHLYENKNGKFVDISESAGIDKPTFGLGLVISDINDDQWLDIYLANDYFLPDNMYINRGDGTFHDRAKTHLNQMSFYGMGADIADINNDGYQDIYVLDMASKDHYRSKTLMASMNVESFGLLVDVMGFSPQYMYNTMQLNDGNGRFNNVAHLSGLAKTDWSWAPLIADVDLDGRKDIFVSNGYRRYALDNDFRIRVLKAKQQYQGEVPVEVKEALYNSIPTEALPNNIFSNEGGLKFVERNEQWGLGDATYSNGAVLSDLDNDGDLDLVINNIDQEALLYRNNAIEESAGNYLKVRVVGESSEIFAKVRIQYGSTIQMSETKRIRGYRSSLLPEAHFGVGDISVIDELHVEFLDGSEVVRRDVSVNQVVVIHQNESKSSASDHKTLPGKKIKPLSPIAYQLDYRHLENDYNDFAREVLLPQKQSTLGPSIAKGDVNGDGLDDLYLSGARNQPGELYIQSNGKFERVPCKVCDQDRKYEDMEALFVDIDNDGDLDLLVVSGGNEEPAGSDFYEDRLYLNDGSGNFERDRLTILKDRKFSGKAVACFDFDQDGDMDILIGNRIIPQSYPVPAQSYLLRNDHGTLVDITSDVVPELTEFGIVNDIEVTDFDNDGWQDFIVVGEWGGIGLFRNDHGKFQNTSTTTGLNEMTGWWYSVHETDVNNDGLKDYVIGNVGANYKQKASVQKPFKIFAYDFDENGSLDIVLSHKYKDHYVPSRGRECSSQQMPFILEKYPTFDQFASATLSHIYGDNTLEESYHREVTEFRSILLLNTGGASQFEVIILPPEAQSFPLLDAVFRDVNGDGFEDAIVAGCIYNTEVETPRLDGGSGMILLSNGKNGYRVERSNEYGFYIPGNVKTLETIHMSNGQEILIAAKNNDVLSLFEIVQ